MMHHSDTRSSEVSSSKVTSIASNKRPTPLDFDEFLPWILTQMNTSIGAFVTRLHQEEYHRKDKRVSTGHSRLSHGSKSRHFAESAIHDKHASVQTSGIRKSAPLSIDHRDIDLTNLVPLTAFYDGRGYLTEIAIIGCPFPISRTLFKAISLCLPFHALLNKLTVSKGGLHGPIVYEISKLLPFSHLTDICLDSSYVAEGNYYLLLEQSSELKNLSLNRCSIDDKVCKEIAIRMDFRSFAKNLRVLSLSSNTITDKGAEALGNALRTNRHLLHLNLCGNRITSVGAACILDHLVEFPFTYDEILEKKIRRREYLENKADTIDKCTEEILFHQKNGNLNANSKTFKPGKASKRTQKKSKFSLSETVQWTVTDIMSENSEESKESVDDPFSPANVLIRDGYTYSTGNLTLCSLNLGYNYLDFSSIVKILEILKYQSRRSRSARCTGLLRIVFEGNRLPNHCSEYEDITKYLNQGMIHGVSSPTLALSQKSRMRRTSFKD